MCIRDRHIVEGADHTGLPGFEHVVVFGVLDGLGGDCLLYTSIALGAYPDIMGRPLDAITGATPLAMNAAGDAPYLSLIHI